MKITKTELRKTIKEEIQNLKEVAGFELTAATKKQIVEFIKRNFRKAKEIKSKNYIEKDSNYNYKYISAFTTYAMWYNNKLYINNQPYGNVSQTHLNFFEKTAKKLNVDYIKYDLDKKEIKETTDSENEKVIDNAYDSLMDMIYKAKKDVKYYENEKKKIANKKENFNTINALNKMINVYKKIIKDFENELNKTNLFEWNVSIQDIKILKDQLFNAWEHLDSKEMFKHLAKETNFNKKELKAFVDSWYENDKRRNKLLMNLYDEDDFYDWFNEYYN